ncbi:MAG TPA: OsmC family protein [Anaerolineaceae bacterium]|nr:OsmC family protein [Anaerolineaceae bacterium]
MDAKVTWKSGMAFTGLSKSAIEIPLDASPDHGGNGEGAAPMELMLMGLGGCTAMDVISILEKKRQQVTHFEIVLHADRAEDHPRVFTRVTLEYVITGHNIDPAAVARAVELSETKYCSGIAMMRKATELSTSYRVVEA